MSWVDAVEETTVGIGTAAGLDSDAAFFLGVAVREAVVNAIRHGAAPDGTRRIAVTLRIRPDATLEVTVRDHGRGFDPCCVPDPLSSENLSRGCGRGIFYIRQFSDDVAFTFPSGGGTTVRIEKRLPRLDPSVDAMVC
jgi:serine/threonine-protein kinase RsbW